MTRHTLPAAAYVVLERNGKVLLMRRKGSGYMDGFYGLPSGHMEKEESPLLAAIRETKEEAGLELRTENMRLALTMHRSAATESKEYIDMFFVADKWEGEPIIAEPDKCDDLGWFPLEKLPENIVPYISAALLAIKDGKNYLDR